jgi:hypothetical protein
MPYTPGQRVTILTGSNAGRKATVLAADQAGRVGVLVDGLADSAFRSYLLASVKAEAVPAPSAQSSRFQSLVVDENFDTLDPARWSLYDGQGHAGNGIRDPKCWSVAGGVDGANGNCLVGTAWWDAGLGKIRTPGMSLRRDAQSFRVECRARVEKDPTGITAANMPLLWPKVYMDSPYEEVNPYETSGPHNAERGMSSFVHYGAVAAGKPAGDQVYFDVGVDGSQWHTVTYERESGVRESCWVDGVQKWTISDPKVLAKREHHPCLQLDALRNADPGRAIRMYVDHLRIWQ